MEDSSWKCLFQVPGKVAKTLGKIFQRKIFEKNESCSESSEILKLETEGNQIQESKACELKLKGIKKVSIANINESGEDGE